MTTCWKIYAREPSYIKNPDDFSAICYRRGLIALGWGNTGDLNKYSSRAEIKQKLSKDYHWRISSHKRELSSYASSLWNFKTKIKKDDIILCPSKNSSLVHVGKMLSKRPYFDKTKMEGKCHFPHRRKVKWLCTLNHNVVLSIWPNGRFGGQQTVTEIKTKLSKLGRVLGQRNSPKISFSKHIPFKPDKEWGIAAELRAMNYLQKKGLNPKNVSSQNKGWDIECDNLLFEIKGRKSPNTVIRLTENEWKAAVKYGRRYTLLIFTAVSMHDLRRAFPIQTPNPARTEEWSKKATYEYFLKE